MDELPQTAADSTALLYTFLQERDCPCPGCGYNVRNLRSAHCPECAMQLQLSVRLTEPRQGALLTGLIGLAAGAGFSGMLLLYILLTLWTYPQRGAPPARFVAVTVGGFAIQGVAVWLWLRSRSAIRQLTPTTRSLLVAGCWALTIANLIVFTYMIR